METHSVHRLMFYDLEPKAITGLCYNEVDNLVAVLRSDNRIEIWDFNAVPFIQNTILLKPQTKLSGMGWYKNNHLYGSDLGGFVKEMDLVTLKEKNSYPVTSGGPCHCIAVDNSSTLLAVGTELGYINIFNIEDDGLSFVKLIQSEKSRILSICWDKDSKYIITSGYNSIKLFNCNGQVKHCMKPTQQSKKRELVIWSVVVTDDFTIIAGDSSGHLTFWNGTNGICTDTIKCLKSDVLRVCLSKNQDKVFCSGIDPDIKTYFKTKMKDKTFKWIHSRDIINHTHDVNGLVQLNDGRICSGGVDSYLSISNISPYRVQLYPPLLQNPSVYVAVESRYVMLRYSTHLELWYLKEFSSGVIHSDPFIKLLELRSNNNELIRCAAISNDGNFIIYSTNESVRVFKFTFEEDKANLLPLSLTNSMLENVYNVCFSKDSKNLVISDNTTAIQVFSTSSKQSSELSLSLNISLADDPKWSNNTINLLATSCCGDYIAVASSNGMIGIWMKSGKKPKFYTFLPRYQYPATAITFHPDENIIYAVYSDFKFIEFSLNKLRYTEFSNSFDSSLLAKYFGDRNLPVTNITFDHDKKSIIMLHTSLTVCIIDKDKVLPVKHNYKKMKLDPHVEKSPIKIKKPLNKKESRFHVVNLQSYLENVNLLSKNDLAEDTGFHVYEKYQHLVHFDNFGSKELVAVEIKPEKFLKRLPPVLQKKKFGRK